MLTLSVLILSAVVFNVLLNKALSAKNIALRKSYEALESEYGVLAQKKVKAGQDNDALRGRLEATIALYEVTKEICKHLDEGKVFNSFKTEISKYIKTGDCQFLKKDEDLSKYNGYIIMPLSLGKKTLGYLAAGGILEADLDKFNILAQQFVLGIKRAVLYRQVQELAVTDGLTGALTRRQGLERFRQELERSRKFKLSFSFLMIDIDHFKMFNDRYGHLVGDAMLREVSKRIKESIRQVDLLSRYGGEEFSVILVETNKAGAAFAAERIRRAAEDKAVRAYDEDLKVTVSIGISAFPEDAGQIEALVEKADSAMYRAKQEGRNRVCVANT